MCVCIIVDCTCAHRAVRPEARHTEETDTAGGYSSIAWLRHQPTSPITLTPIGKSTLAANGALAALRPLEAPNEQCVGILSLFSSSRGYIQRGIKPFEIVGGAITSCSITRRVYWALGGKKDMLLSVGIFLQGLAQYLWSRERVVE